MIELHYTNARRKDSIPDRNELLTSFNMFASPGTDIWVEPPETIRFTAPFLHAMIHMTGFYGMRTRIEGDWSVDKDQAGLLIAMHYKMGNRDRKWVKAGIEFVNGTMHLSVATKDEWAERKLWPIPEEEIAAAEVAGTGVGVSIGIGRKCNGALWIYWTDVEGGRHQIYEVPWAFDGEEMIDCWVGTYCARPDQNAAKDLRVRFSEWMADIELH